MHVLHVYPYYPPAWEYGGALRVVHHTATTLTEHGHDVTVYTTDTAGSAGRVSEPSPTTKDGVTIRYFPNVSNALARRYHVPLPLGLRSALRDTIDEFDVVHVHGFPHLLAWMTALVARRQSVPYVLTPHGTINRPDDAGSSLKFLFSSLFGRSILSHAERVIALTEDERDRLTRHGVAPERVVRIPNGTSRPERTTEIERQFEERYGYTDCWLVVFVGRLHPSKGLDVLLQVADRVGGAEIAGKPVQFAVIGPDDGYREQLDEDAAPLDSVDVLGFVPEAEKNAALHAADLYVLPSRGEGQPLSVLEACAAGTPVLISEESSLPEVEAHGAGHVLERDSRAFAQALEGLLEDAEERKRMGRRARMMIDEEFSWDAVVTQLESLYESCSS